MRTDAPQRSKSPIQKYITFSGGKGIWSYWDGDKKENVEVKELEFVVMEIRNSITGWCEAENARINSHLFNTTKDVVKVRCNNKNLYVGTYADGKAEINSFGGNYTVNVLAMARIDGEFIPVDVQLSKSAMTPWIDFVDSNRMSKIYAGAVRAATGGQKTKGSVKYYPPVFTLVGATPEDLAAADAFADGELKPYLTQE